MRERERERERERGGGGEGARDSRETVGTECSGAN